MTESVKFVILGQPCSKANSRQLMKIQHGPRKGDPIIIKSEEARIYEHDAMRQIPASARVMFTGPVRVDIRCYYKTERSDLDESIILDVMQCTMETQHGKHINLGDGKWAKGEKQRVMTRAGVYKNDRQVREKHIFHGIDALNPRAEIEVRPLHPQQIQAPLMPHVTREHEPEPF